MPSPTRSPSTARSRTDPSRASSTGAGRARGDVMTYRADDAVTEPLRAAVDAWPGTVVLKFGAPWCGHCQVAHPCVQAWLSGRADLAHLKVDDGKGRPLGRSFGVTRWSPLIVLEGGRERARMVRPTRASDLDPLRDATTE